MPYLKSEIVLEAKRMDLLTYLQSYEPAELVRLSPGTYTTRTHDSLKISNGKWMWWSRGIGGRSALDYLIKVRGYSFVEAVERIAGRAAVQPPVSIPAEKAAKKQLLLPEPCRYQTYVVSYLQRRGIDLQIIEFCLRTGRIYESGKYHNAVFVGMDKEGKARYAALRGIGTDFIGEAGGSDKCYSFCLPSEGKSREVHLFESAIDLLSYATLLQMQGEEWNREHLLSLAGVYQPAKDIKESKVPAALARFLQEHPEVERIVFHLDNDKAGRLASLAIRTVLTEQYQTQDQPPPAGKDYNDYLCMRKGLAFTHRGRTVRTRFDETDRRREKQLERG